MRNLTPEKFYGYCTETQEAQFFDLLKECFDQAGIKETMDNGFNKPKFEFAMTHFLKMSSDRGPVHVAVECCYRWKTGMIDREIETVILFKDECELVLEQYKWSVQSEDLYPSHIFN